MRKAHLFVDKDIFMIFPLVKIVWVWIVISARILVLIKFDLRHKSKIDVLILIHTKIKLSQLKKKKKKKARAHIRSSSRYLKMAFAFKSLSYSDERFFWIVVPFLKDFYTWYLFLGLNRENKSEISRALKFGWSDSLFWEVARPEISNPACFSTIKPLEFEESKICRIKKS